MKKVLTYDRFINESVRDMMKPKSEEEIKKSLNLSDKTPNEKLLLGVQNNVLWLVKEVIDSGANVNYKDISNYSMLMWASYKGNLEIVKYLVENGANVNHISNFGNTALIEASSRGYLDIVKYLVENGANINIKRKGSDTALNTALYFKHYDVVNYLKSLSKTNESIRGMMKPKSDEEIRKSLEPLLKDIALSLQRLSTNGMAGGMGDYEDAYPFVVSHISEIIWFITNTYNRNSDAIAIHLANIYLGESKNESVRSLMTGISTEKAKELIDNLPPKDRYSHITKYKMEDLYSEEELDDFLRCGSPTIKFGAGILKNKFWAIKEAIEEDDSIIRRFNSILPSAIRPCDIDILKFLIDKGFAIHHVDEWALQKVTIDGNIDKVKFLLEAGAKPTKNIIEIALNKYEYSEELVELILKYADKSEIKKVEIKGHQYNKPLLSESIRSLMLPKSEEEIWNSIKNLDPTPMLIKSAGYGYMNGIKTALEKGANINFDRGAALMQASDSGSLEAVKFLVDNYIDMAERGSMFLMPACINGHIDIVKYLLSKGLLRNVSSDRFQELLNMTKNNGHEDITELLISHHKKYNKKTNESIRSLMTPKSEEEIRKTLELKTPIEKLKLGVENGILWAVKQAIEEGVDIHINSDRFLRVACTLGHSDIVKLLIDNGADVHFSNEHALDLAVTNNHIEVVKVLLDAGIIVRDYTLGASNNNTKIFLLLQQHVKTEKIKKFIMGGTPNFKLLYGSTHGHLWVVKQSLEEGADIHVDNEYALHVAIINNRREVVKLLVENGADIHSNNDKVLRWASAYGYTEIVKQVLEKGADVHVNDDYSLDLAVTNNHIEVVKLLLDAGADIHNDLLKWVNHFGNTKMINILKQYTETNESIRSLMKPESEEEIEKLLLKYNFNPEIYKYLEGVGYNFVTIHQYTYNKKNVASLEFFNKEVSNRIFIHPSDTLDEIEKKYNIKYRLFKLRYDHDNEL